MNSQGERCHSTTSIRAVEAISANGMIVHRTFERISRRYPTCDPDNAIAAVTSSMLAT